MKVIIAACVVAMALGCSTKVSESEMPLTDVESEAKRMLHDYHDAMKAGGLMAEFDYLDSSDSFFWVPPGFDAAINYDSVRTILEQTATSIANIELEWETLKVFPLSDQIATYAGIVKSVSTDTSGTTTSVRILESGTLVKRANGWKLLSGQSRLLNSE